MSRKVWSRLPTPEMPVGTAERVLKPLQRALRERVARPKRHTGAATSSPSAAASWTTGLPSAARHRFRTFETYAASVIDHAGLMLEISTPFDWRMQCPPGTNPRTVRNFPIQSTGAEILHVACVLAERRGIEIVAPVHDALMAEADADREEEVSAALDQVMRDASRVVLRGYELRTDVQIIRAGARYFDDRGLEMWTTVTGLLAKLEKETA
jgi:hypothetical protein